MAACHARGARELIAEKKEEGNVKNLSQVVNQLKGKIKSKETVKTLNHLKLNNKIIFIQRSEESNGSKRSSRSSFDSQGSTEDTEPQHTQNVSASESLEMKVLVNDKSKSIDF